MKKNLPYILFYFFFIAFVLLLLIILEQPFLLIVLLPFIVAPVCTTIAFQYAIRHISFHAHSLKNSVELGNQLLFTLEAKNDSIIPIFSCDVNFRAENLFIKNTIRQVVSVPLLQRKTVTIEIPIDVKFPGMITFHVSEVKVSDAFHFFTLTLPQTIRLQVPVIPAVKEISLPEQNTAFEGEEELEENGFHGLPSSDIKGIREFRPGDRLQMIHWKLSAKMDDLFVKERANVSTLSIVLLPELSKNNITETVTTLRSLMHLLLKEEQPFSVCLYHHLSCTFEHLIIKTQDDCEDCFIKLYYLPLYTQEDAAKEAFIASSQPGSSLLQISGSYISGTDLSELY